MLAAKCLRNGDGVVFPPPVNPSGCPSWAYKDSDVSRVRVLAQEYWVMDCLVNELLALLNGTKVRRSLMNVGEMLPFDAKELRFV